MVDFRDERFSIALLNDFSIRLLPHHQDTGAFFVALFRKADVTTTEDGTSQKRPAEEVPFNEEG